MANYVQTYRYPTQIQGYNNSYNPNTQGMRSGNTMPNNYAPVGAVAAQAVDTLSLSSKNLGLQKAQELKEQGNVYRLQGKYDQAIHYYKEALKIDPKYTDVLYNLAKTYNDTNNMDAAIATLVQLSQIDPKDFESKTLLGAYYEKVGNYDSALVQYKEVLKQEPNYDFARRNMYRTHIKKVALSEPETADQLTQKIARENLQKALQLIQTKAPPYINANLQGITIAFGTTQEVNKNENLAQYENENKKILVSNKLMFASPNVIAAYLVHEAVHAGDRDSLTSIREEQDAFGEMTRFWIANHNGVLDPDLSLAMKLYQEHPANLDAKVASLYVKRDPGIRRTSPNHGEPSGGNSWLSNVYDTLRSLMPAQPLTGNNLPLSSLNQDEHLYYQTSAPQYGPFIPPNGQYYYPMPPVPVYQPKQFVYYPYPVYPQPYYVNNNPFKNQDNTNYADLRLRAEGR